MENQTWMTVKECTAYLRCSKPSLYRYINKHGIIKTKLIGKTLISKQAIDAALEASTQQ